MSETEIQQIPEVKILKRVMERVGDGATIIVHEPGSMIDIFVATDLRFTLSEPVLVIEPTRYRAIRAANILGSDMANCAIGDRGLSGTGSGSANQAMMTFTTYGYTLATKSIRDAKVIVLNGSQNPSIDAALCKAMIKHRLLHEENPPKVVILASSVGFDEKAELDYWGEFNPEIIPLVPDRVIADDQSRSFVNIDVSDATLGLLDEGHRGILIFVAGQKEAADTAEEIRTVLNNRSDSALQVEIVTLFGRVSPEECTAAIAAPEPGTAKILVGTSSLDTIGGLEWVDAAVSSGRHKAHVQMRPGTVDLREMPITVDLLATQTLVTGAYNKSSFILCGSTAPEDLKEILEPEIKRLPLTYILLHAYSLDIDPQGEDSPILQLDLNPYDMQAAITTLFRLGLVEDAQLTDDGHRAKSMPISVETAAFLCHAIRLDILPQSLILAAVFEIGTLRRDHNLSHNLDHTSDLLDAAKAFAACYRLAADNQKDERRVMMEKLNIDRRQFHKVQEVLWMFQRSFHLKANTEAFTEGVLDVRLTCQFRQCLIAGSLENLAMYNPADRHRPVITTTGGEYKVDSRTSVIFPTERAPIIASIKWVTPKNPELPKFMVARNITLLDWDDFVWFNNPRGAFKISKKTLGGMVYDTISVFDQELFLRKAQESTPDVDRQNTLGSQLHGMIARRLHEKHHQKPQKEVTETEGADDTTPVGTSHPARGLTPEEQQRRAEAVLFSQRTQDMVQFCDDVEKLKVVTEKKVTTVEYVEGMVPDSDRVLASADEIKQLAERFNTARG